MLKPLADGKRRSMRRWSTGRPGFGAWNGDECFNTLGLSLMAKVRCQARHSYFMKLGNHNEMEGNAIRMMSRITSAIQNGMIPV